MDSVELYKEITEFSKETHGSTDYDSDTIFVMGQERDQFAPLKYLQKKLDSVEDPKSLFKKGFVFDSLDLKGGIRFDQWFEHQFGKKLKRSVAKTISILHEPNSKEILTAIEAVNKNYEILRTQQIIMNGKNLPVQMGEWYAKCIFGLHQVKSTSQRGFDFMLNDKIIEVKIHWADTSSPKGVKIRKSLLELSDHAIIVYVARNFMIREICFLDSDFILRKFAAKGHTIFLKDTDVSQYFFTKSDKHFNKVVNSSALLRFASPQLAMRLEENFQ
ncbi:MAG: hypothetical protein HN509_17805 [Halobacteriovoraceae bacterium]|jgi:hypothetical protein|nr:hypothetical protein [Halobacteriovoraceae bacterium]MBT5095141.1 hypothetical protein [Halobacteriovoraceae bacterium]